MEISNASSFPGNWKRECFSWLFLNSLEMLEIQKFLSIQSSLKNKNKNNRESLKKEKNLERVLRES